LAAGEQLHAANTVVEHLYLIISGRLRLTVFDVFGNAQFESFLKSGSQYGGLSSVAGQSTPIACAAEDPTTLLQLSYEDMLKLTAKYAVLRRNIARLVASDMRRAVLRDKSPERPRFVGLLHQSDDRTRHVSRRLIDRLLNLGEDVCVLSDKPSQQLGGKVKYRYIKSDTDGQIDESAIQHQIQDWSDSPRLLVDVDASVGSRFIGRILHACDLVLWLVTPDNWQAAVPILDELERRAVGWKDKLCAVWLLEDERCAPQSDALTRLVSREIKISFRDPTENMGRALQLGFERLVHLMRGVQIGVALGGGAARGMAHLGVLRALEEHGIVVDMIAGTSAGAMTGTVYASGMGVDYSVDCFCRDLKPSWLFRSIPKGDQWWLVHKYRTGQFDPMLRKYLQDLKLEQLPVPMNSITVDLISGKVVVRDVGDAVHGIVESINLPVLSLPIMRDGQALVDGGMINNVPADVLVAKGCNFVIAVSVTAKMELEFARNRPDTPLEKMKSPSTLQTILRTYLVQNASVNALGVQPADVIIEPDVTRFQLTDFVRTDELADIGEQTAIRSLDQINTLLHRLDGELFPLQPVENDSTTA
jgi:predicted acylesterase/phospholipase RssA/CRP-like cAMP-binding protein